MPLVLCGQIALQPISSVYFEEAKKAIEAADAAMGDWQGHWYGNDGSVKPLVAQVIALGKGTYRVNFLREFDRRVKPLAVLDGKKDGEVIRFAGGDWQAMLLGGRFSGTTSGQAKGGFTLKKVYRISPTMGLRPPKEAIVLFDGSDFDEWQPAGQQKRFVVNLGQLIGGDNQAAYLYSEVWSPRVQKAVLQIGSDDGVKAWLNGELVHANNSSRGLQPGQDKVTVNLKDGVNRLLLKVTNGGGDWAACARLVGIGGKKLGIREIVDAKKAPGGTDAFLGKNDGYLTVWSISGPYSRAGKSGPELFDIVFAPEKNRRQAEWKQILPGKTAKPKVQWKLLDGAMEVNHGGIISIRKFQDYRLHLEFRTPFMPEARGQGRGNSGVYNQGRYEVQVLDSYGLEGADNECGGIYHVARPRVNMCAPPLQWQTYDIWFHSARYANGNKVRDAVITVYHNGVLIHQNQAIPHPTGSAPLGESPEPGGIFLQDHGNAVQYRNIWIVPGK